MELTTKLIIWGSVLLLIVLSITFCCVSNKRWAKKMADEFNSTSTIAETALGPIEYSKQGQAPYVLLFHGTPGLHDGLI